MTITTAKRSLRRALPRLLPLAAALLVALPAQADWRVVPTVGLSETWTDNIDLRPGRDAHSDLITQLSTGVQVLRTGRRLNLKAGAQWHEFGYLHGGGSTSNDRSRSYDGALQGILVDDLLYVDAAASRRLQTISAFGPRLGNDLYFGDNRTEVDTWSISPYLVHRFGSTANLQLRYTRSAVESDLRNSFGNSTADTVSASLSSGRRYDTLGWGLNYIRDDQDNSLWGESSSENLSANLRYRVIPRLWMTANAGYDRYDFGGLGGSNEGRNWALGVDWSPSSRTSLQASLGRHYYGKTGSLTASHRSRSTVWTLSYSDAVTSTRQQFLLPSAIDTAALLDRLFTTAFPDPEQRRQVVEAYIQANGLPPSLADSVNYLSNRYVRQKSLQGAMVYRTARSTGTISVSTGERIALSDSQTDSVLLGSQLSTLNDNVRQRGVNATYNYRLNSRSSVVGSFDFFRSRSRTTDIEEVQRILRVGLTRRYSQHLTGTIDLRRRSGARGLTSSTPYQEHAITASLSMQL